MRSYHDQLQSLALTDLTNRAKSGILTYLFVWLLLAFVFGLNKSSPAFFYINTAILTGIVLLRSIHYLVFRRSLAPNVGAMHQWLVFSVLLGAVHWGAMIAWITHDPEMMSIRTLALLTLPAFGLGGACTLSISTEIRTLYPTLMYLPVMAVLIHQGTAENMIISALLAFSMLYIFSSSRASHDDYWKAITNHLVAEERAELMEQLSTTDPLTQLRNRMYFDSEYAKEWKRSSRLKCPLSILMLDIDYFKKINDNYGHVFGDDCLRNVARAIAQETRRPTDCVARYGGEEFIVMLPNTKTSGAKMIAERMRQAVEDTVLNTGDESVNLTISVGGATVTPDFKGDRNWLIQHADEALYHAKNSGRNQCQIIPADIS